MVHRALAIRGVKAEHMKGCLKYIAILGIGILIGCIAMGRCSGNGFVCGADDWVSPTSYNDPSSAWTDETKTYDANTGTYGYTSTDAAYIELLVSSMDCDKVRIWAAKDGFGIWDPWVYVDVYYGSAWHNIKNGAITKSTWVELPIGSVQSVTKVRIACSLSFLENFRLYEFQFNHYVPPPPVPTSINLLPAGDSNYVNENHQLNATVYDQYSEPMAGAGVIWSIESGPGWFESYDEETDENGIAYAVISSDEEGETIVKCSADGYPAVYDTAVKSWEVPPVYILVLDPVTGTNYVGTNHTISARFYVDGELGGGAAIEWEINDVGWFRSYDEETDGDSGIGYAVISSNVSGITTVCCEAVGYEGVSDCVTAYWLCPGQGGLTIEEVGEWAASQNFTTLAELQAWLGTLNYTTLEYIAGWLESQNYTTATDINDWAELNGVVMGGAGMPLWYLFGLIALAVGAWWAKSLMVNIMLAAMAGAGFPLIESTLGGASAGAVYYGVLLVLVLAVIYSLVSIFTRVEHL